MFKTTKWSIAAVVLLAMTGCSKETESPSFDEGFGTNPVQFETNIKPLVRATDDKWTSNDEIGVFMTNSGVSLSQTTNVLASNKNYVTTDGSGNFTAKNTENQVIFPESDQAVDIISYYPYTTNLLSGNIYNVNVQDQSEQSNIDLLYSNNLKGVKASTPRENIKLNFKHMLSKLVFNVTSDEGRLDGLSLELIGFESKAKFNLANGALTNVEGSENIKALANGSKCEAIIIPNSTSKHFIFKANSHTYKFDATTNQYEAGKMYVYNINLKGNGDIVVVNPNGTIENWDVVDGGNHDLTPGEGETTDEPADITIEDGQLNIDLATNEAAKKVVKISTTGKWTVASSAEWATTDLKQGEGEKDLTINIEENTGAERSAKITIKSVTELRATGKELVINIHQAAKQDEPTPQPGETAVIVKEAFSKLGVGEKVEGKKPQEWKFSEIYKNYVDFEGADYTVSFDKGALRNTSKMDGHIWFGANHDNWFKMNNIPTKGYNKNLTIKFSLASNGTGTDGVTPAVFSIKVNDKLAKISGPDAFGGQNIFSDFTAEVGNVEGETITIEFTAAQTGITNGGIRLDNIVVEGSK